jgi:hypothetical protein
MKSLFVELGRVLLRLALDRAVREALPRIYNRLDVKMPELLSKATPTQVKREIADAISATTGKVVAPSQIEAVIGLYSPVAGAIRAFKK